MKIFRIRTLVQYESYIEVKADNWNQAAKKAEHQTFDNMNDDYQPSITQHEYDKDTFEEIS